MVETKLEGVGIAQRWLLLRRVWLAEASDLICSSSTGNGRAQATFGGSRAMFPIGEVRARGACFTG